MKFLTIIGTNIFYQVPLFASEDDEFEKIQECLTNIAKPLLVGSKHFSEPRSKRFEI